MEESVIGQHGYEAMSEGQRRDERDSLLVFARLTREDGGEPEQVRVRNVSSGGLMAQTSDAYRPGMRVAIELAGLGKVDGSVAWAEAGRIGIAFDHPVEKTLARAAPKAADFDLMPPTRGDFRRPPLKSA